MRNRLALFGMVCVMALISCSTGSKDGVLLSRAFPTMSWERFDFVTHTLEVKKPTTYNMVLNATFDPSYSYNYFSVVFTVFDAEEHPFRSKSYKFNLKNNDGSWKSELINGEYHFTIPINTDFSINEPGVYLLQLENRMPVTPLMGIKEISISDKR